MAKTMYQTQFYERTHFVVRRMRRVYVGLTMLRFLVLLGFTLGGIGLMAFWLSGRLSILFLPVALYYFTLVRRSRAYAIREKLWPVVVINSIVLCAGIAVLSLSLLEHLLFLGLIQVVCANT